MIAGLYMSFATVTCVDEVVLALVVQFIQQSHSWQFGSAQWREFIMLFTSNGQEGITSIHQITAEWWIRIWNGWEGGCWLLTMESNNKKHLQRKNYFQKLIIKSTKILQTLPQIKILSPSVIQHFYLHHPNLYSVFVISFQTGNLREKIFSSAFLKSELFTQQSWHLSTLKNVASHIACSSILTFKNALQTRSEYLFMNMYSKIVYLPNNPNFVNKCSLVSTDK